MTIFEKFIFEPSGGMFRDFQGLITHFAPKDLSLFRKLLPDRFSMPALPVVGICVTDYLHVFPWPMTPYREWAVLLKNEIQGETGWYVLTLPVTSWIAKVGGRILGFPKVIIDEISFDKAGANWITRSSQKGVNTLALSFHPGITRSLEPWEKQLIDDPSFFKGNTHQLVPPEKGTRSQRIIFEHVVDYAWSPVPGMIHVEVDPSESWAGLVPDVAVFPGTYNHYQGGINLIAERFD
ncbi:MAG: acetoacetate decarboxylase family protein [Anaerolineaceae bacterium]